MARVAFIGLGTMGSGMVRNLLSAGHEVTVYNRTPEKAEPLSKAGAQVALSVAEAVRDTDYVMYCLSDDAAVEAVVFGPDGVFANVDKKALVIDLSTISPDLGAREHSEADAVGVRFLDAPVFGSKGEAENGGLWVVVGGRREDFDAALTVFEPIGESVHYMGTATSGNKMKLVGNLLRRIPNAVTGRCADPSQEIWTEPVRRSERAGCHRLQDADLLRSGPQGHRGRL